MDYLLKLKAVFIRFLSMNPPERFSSKFPGLQIEERALTLKRLSEIIREWLRKKPRFQTPSEAITALNDHLKEGGKKIKILRLAPTNEQEVTPNPLVEYWKEILQNIRTDAKTYESIHGGRYFVLEVQVGDYWRGDTHEWGRTGYAWYMETEEGVIDVCWDVPKDVLAQFRGIHRKETNKDSFEF